MHRSAKTYLFLLLILAVSCRNDPPLVREPDRINSWIYNTVSDCYLWASSIKEVESTNLYLDPVVYFNSELHFRQDISKEYFSDLYGDRFSCVYYNGQGLIGNYTGVEEDRESASADNFFDKFENFGFGFRMFFNAATNLVDYCQVTYVYPGTTAEKCGIKRGDCFNAVSGIPMPMSVETLSALFSQPGIGLDFYYPDTIYIQLAAASYDAFPIIFDTILSEDDPVGYMVYNHFEPGSSDKYHSLIAEKFTEFKKNGVKDLVIDLRYNAGGELETCKFFSSLIVPPEFLGTEMLFKETKESFGDPAAYEAEYFLKTGTVRSANASIKNLYFITSSSTASAAEAMIHALRPFYKRNILIIGERTAGKNLGGAVISNRAYEYELYLITMRIHNIERLSGYEDGIVPDVYCDEIRFVAPYDDPGIVIPHLGRFGDRENEIMLSTLFSLIRDADGSHTFNTGIFAMPAVKCYTIVPEKKTVTNRLAV